MEKKIVVIVLFQFLMILCKGQSEAELHELREKINSSQDLIEKLKLYEGLSRLYVGFNTDSAQQIAREGITICEKNGEFKFRSKLYNTLGIAAISAGNGEYAISSIDSAIYYDERTSNTSGLAASFGNKGSVHYMLGNYAESQQLQFRALKLYEELGNKSAIATTWTNIHGTYYVLKDWSNSLKAGHLALKYFKELDEKDGMAFMAYNLCTVHLDLDQIDSAEIYAHQCLELFTMIGNVEGIADGQRALSDVSSYRGNYKYARSLLVSALESYDKIGAYYKKLLALIDMAKIDLDEKLYADALHLTDSILPLAKEMGARQFIRDILKLKLDIYSEQNNFEDYYTVSRQYFPLRDSIINEETREQIKRVESEYKVDQQQRENESLRQQQEILELELHKKNTRIIVWSLLIVLLILSLYWWYSFRKQREIQRTLELRQTLLQTQMNPHFVFNSLSSIQSFMYTNQPMSAAKFLSSFASLMRGILDHSAAGWIYLEKECEWLDKYLELQKLRFEEKFTYSITMDDNIIPSQLKVPAMIIQPFAENSIEHGFKNIQYQGKIEIHFSLINDKLEVTIRDNGRGFEQNSGSKDSNEIHAIKITRDRLKILNRGRRSQIVLQIGKVETGGTEVKFVLPINE